MFLLLRTDAGPLPHLATHIKVASWRLTELTESWQISLVRGVLWAKSKRDTRGDLPPGADRGLLRPTRNLAMNPLRPPMPDEHSRDERWAGVRQPRMRPDVGTPVPAVTSTCSTLSTWLTDVPRSWRTPSAMPFMPWM